jgi:starvation-inducible DNA-binding protein
MLPASDRTTRKLFATRDDVRETARAQVCLLLNHRLADAVDLQTQCKQARWNVRGAGRSELHAMFDRVHADVDRYVDLLAERIVQLGERVECTARKVAARSELAEYPAKLSTDEEHVRCLGAALGSFSSRMRFAVLETDALEDVDSSDICGEVARGIDQWLWIVEAHAQSRG